MGYGGGFGRDSSFIIFLILILLVFGTGYGYGGYDDADKK